MDSDTRPNPEELLKAVQHEEEQAKRGRLKIFLGMAAGVGKTYAMLQEAQKLKQKGEDVVVGVVDTHERKETAALLEGLQVIPQKKIPYKGVLFSELDIDEILKIKPDLVLVDELAHTNVPGSRHIKRWQDVEEILANGIDVLTTLNVQHIESLKDMVEGIAGVTISETIPDSIIDSAAFIELVDITPDELLGRLKDGKVYLGEQPQMAVEHFFKEDRLTALREIVLRYTAEKVDHDLHEMVSSINRSSGWKPRERLLVAVSHSPHSKKLIRTTRRLAFTLDASWIAVHVNDGRLLNDDESATLGKNLELARDLGAEVITVNDPDIANAIQSIARRKNVTQIIIGRPPKRPFFDFFERYTLLERLAKELSDIDVHVIRQENLTQGERKRIKLSAHHVQFTPYVFVCCLVILLSFFNWLCLPYIGYKLTGFIFLIGILVLSLFFKKGPIFFGCLLYALIWAYFFIPPEDKHRFIVPYGEDKALLVLYFLTALVTGVLIDRSREHKEMLLKREARTQTLYEIVHDIATMSSTSDLINSIKARLGVLMNGTCEIFIKNPNGGLSFDKCSFVGSDEKEKNAAKWVMENGKEAGWSTTTLPLVHNLFIPIKGFQEIAGVLAFRPRIPGRTLSVEEKNFFYTVGHELIHCLKRSKL